MQRARRPKRTKDEIHSLFLAAATEVFSAQGYDAATTRAIAEKAGASETLLFRHFGSKAELFRQSVAIPVATGLAEYIQHWNDTEIVGSTPLEMTERYVELLYEFLHRNRAKISALHAGQSDMSAGSLAKPFDDLFQENVLLEDALFQAEGTLNVDTEVHVRVCFGLVLAMAFFDDWLMPTGRNRLSPERVKAEMTSMIYYGTVARSERQR